jgi:hypothetical protein
MKAAERVVVVGLLCAYPRKSSKIEKVTLYLAPLESHEVVPSMLFGNRRSLELPRHPETHCHVR